MSVLFIEGPDHKGKKDLYTSLIDAMREDQAARLRHNTCFYEVISTIAEYPHEPYFLNDDLLRMQMILDMGEKNPDMNFIICSGPIYLLNLSMELNDLESAKRVSSVFSSEHYQNVSVISVTSSDEDMDVRNAYRQTSSRYLHIMSDTDKGNKYRLFINKHDTVSRKLFLKDVLSLINN